MKSKFKTVLLNFLWLSTILYLVSCSTIPKTIPREINISATELSNKIPLKAGLYLSPSFKNAKYLFHSRQMVTATTPVGDTLCYGSEKIMKNIFREIIIIGSTDVLSAKTYDVIITPEVVTLDFDQDQCHGWRFNTECVVQTVIKWNIVSPEGKEIYASTIKNDDTRVSGSRVEQFLEISLKINFQKAQEDIYTSTWWEKQWWKNSD